MSRGDVDRRLARSSSPREPTRRTTMPHALLLQKPANLTVAAKTLARHARTVARIHLGLVFFVFGLNYFLELLPPPSGPIPDGAAALALAFMKAGYLFPLIKGTEVVAGALLLA